MIDKNTIFILLEQKLKDTDVFAVEVCVKSNNKIQIFLDSDTAVTLGQCADISKFIESGLDRDVEDFEIEVSSAGLDQPLQMIRQYRKNIGKQLKVVTREGKLYAGMLQAAGEESIDMAVIDDDKKIKSKLNRETKIIHLLINDIKEAKRIISFK